MSGDDLLVTELGLAAIQLSEHGHGKYGRMLSKAADRIASLTQQLAEAQAERDSLRLELQAEQHNHQQDNAYLIAARDQAQAALRAVREKATTVFVESEWKQALAWRERFLNEDDECAPLPNQLVCYAIFDAMVLREVAALAPAEPTA